jgi:putative FmdB family regulatory protein
MSVYEFACRDCKKKFQEVIPISNYEPKKIHCPKCKSKHVDRIWGAVNVHTSKKS